MVLRVIADWCWLMLGILVLGAPLAGCASAYSHGYKLGDLIGAQEVLRSVLAEDAGLGEARLYLAIVALRRHEDARALEELGALRPQIHQPRIAAAVERAMATKWARDVREASRLPAASLREPSWRVYRDRYRPLFP